VQIVREHQFFNLADLIGHPFAQIGIILFCALWWTIGLPTDIAKKGTALKHVVFLGTGARSYMNPDELAETGIHVHLIKGYGDTAVAECAIALMWEGARGLAKMDRGIREGNWLRDDGMQLTGKTLGLIGFGGIAAEVARIGYRAMQAGRVEAISGSRLRIRLVDFVNGQRVSLRVIVPDVADVQVSGVVDGDVFPIVQRHVDDGERRARVALAVDGVENLFLRPASVVVGPVHIDVPAAGDDAGAFLDAQVVYTGDQPDTRRNFLAGSGLGIARGQRRSQQ